MVKVGAEGVLLHGGPATTGDGAVIFVDQLGRPHAVSVGDKDHGGVPDARLPFTEQVV